MKTGPVAGVDVETNPELSKIAWETRRKSKLINGRHWVGGENGDERRAHQAVQDAHLGSPSTNIIPRTSSAMEHPPSSREGRQQRYSECGGLDGPDVAKHGFPSPGSQSGSFIRGLMLIEGRKVALEGCGSRLDSRRLDSWRL